MFKKSIHDIEIIEEIESLITNRIVENKQIEYKSKLPENDNESKINCLLKPVCSFANTNDGFIVYGIKEEKGFTIEIVGVQLQNIDDTKRRIEQLICDNTEDQITGIDIAVHKLENRDLYLIIIKVRKSWYGPHRIKINNYFYARNSAGSYAMDMAEIRNVINLSANLIDNVNKFKINRLIDIESGLTLTPLDMGACIVLHVVSLPGFMTGYQCNMEQLQNVGKIFLPENLNTMSEWNRKIVLEGLLGINQLKGGFTDRYDLVFRTGRIESVTVFPPSQQFNGDDFENIIPSAYCEKLLISDTNRFLEMLKILGFQPPIILFLSYIGIKDYLFETRAGGQHKFDRNTIQLFSEVMDSFDVKAEKILLPLFDSVWHCCGLSRSENYNENGEYVNTIK